MSVAIQADAGLDAAADRARQDSQLTADVQAVHRLHEQIHTAVADRFDSSRVLGIVAAAASAEQYLVYTVPDLISQIEDSGHHADLVIGLNNGWSCDLTIAYLSAMPGTQVIQLETEEKLTPTHVASCFMPGDPAGTRYRIPDAPDGQHRIFVVHQRPGPHAAGKIRMLDDLVRGLLLPSIFSGWCPPAALLAFDAETVLIAHAENRSLSTELAQVRLLLERMGGNLERVVNTLLQLHASTRQRRAPSTTAAGQPADQLESNGLRVLLELLNTRPELSIVGAITRFCAYDSARKMGDVSVLLPNVATVCSAMHTMYNYVCGLLPGCLCMPGGATLGRTSCMLSLLGAISASYPGTTSEDAILTVLAEAIGFRTTLCDRVLMTNRCPTIDEWTAHQPPRRAWQQQFARWYAGFDAVERLYGRHNASPVLGPSSEDFLTASLAIFWKTLRQTDDLPGSLALLHQFASCGTAYEEIRTLAHAAPDQLVGADGRPAWS